MIFLYQKLISDIRNLYWFSDIRKSFSDIRKFTADKNVKPKVYTNVFWISSDKFLLCSLHGYSGVVHFITFSWLLVTTGSWPILFSSTTQVPIYLSKNPGKFWFSDIRESRHFLRSENDWWYKKLFSDIWYQKLFFGIRKCSDFLISEIIFWYQKIISDIRKAWHVLTSKIISDIRK